MASFARLGDAGDVRWLYDGRGDSAVDERGAHGARPGGLTSVDAGSLTLVAVLGGAAVVAGVAAISIRNLMRAVVAYAVASVFLAALFFVLAAPFVAALELTVGAGLISVLFLVALILAGGEETEASG